MRYPVRPLWVVGLTWLVVCLIGTRLPLETVRVAAITAGIVTALLVLVPLLRRYRTVILIAATAAVSCVLLMGYTLLRYAPPERYVYEKVNLRVKADTTQSVVELRVLSGDLPAGTRLQLWQVPPDVALSNHDIVEAAFVVNPPDTAGINSVMQKASGVYYCVSPVDRTGADWQVEAGSASVIEMFTDWRRALAQQLLCLLSDDVGSVVTGICFGVDEGLSGPATAKFRSCGVSHLFAVSGLHLSILTYVLLQVLRRMKLPRRLCAGLTASAVLLFCLLMGGEPSVTRAGVLCLFVCGGGCFRRQADARNSMGAALAFLLLINPYAAYDAGLLLSFFATFGLVFFAPAVQRWLRKLPLKGMVFDSAVEAVGITLAATAATLPVSMLFFGQLSVVGVLANLLMTAPSSLLLVLGWLVLPLVVLGWGFLYHPLVLMLGWIAKALLWLAEGLTRLPLVTVAVRDAYWLVWLFGGLVLIGLSLLLLRRHGLRVAAGCLVAILAVGMWFRYAAVQDTVRMFKISTEQDAAVCVVYEGRAVLAVAPTKTETLYAVRRMLQAEGILLLDAVFISSREQRTMGYLPIVLEDYTADAAFYRPSSAQVPLWDIGNAVWNEEGLLMELDGYRLAFYDTAEADMIVTDECLTVVEQGSKRGIAEENGRSPWLWIKEGTVLIK